MPATNRKNLGGDHKNENVRPPDMPTSYIYAKRRRSGLC